MNREMTVNELKVPLMTSLPTVYITPDSTNQETLYSTSHFLNTPLETTIPPLHSLQCCICHSVGEMSSSLLLLSDLLPRIQRMLFKQFSEFKKIPKSDFNKMLLCKKHVQKVIQQRLSELIDEDLFQHSRLQEDAMKHMGQYELGEEYWQSQFEKQSTFGDKAADTIAQLGGSWTFVIGLGVFLIIWTIVNILIEIFDSDGLLLHWDPYPFILLNLFLSCLSAFQAPIIMMVQNRQDARDRTESNYISKMILRNEYQTRHINAKLDHLLSLQWQRLLEIQELQMFSFQLQQSFSTSHLKNNADLSNKLSLARMRPISSKKSLLERHLNSCGKNDLFARLLLRHYFGLVYKQDSLYFSRWQLDGDNFYGSISKVSLHFSGFQLESIRFELIFSVQNASLDDIFSGEKTVVLRNDFDYPHMHMLGKVFFSKDKKKL
jgi:uncharacterized membrane protein